ncbi:MAG: cytochrome c3 family protein [Ignavibacteria bacterium]
MNIRRKFVLIAAAIFSVITLAALAFNTSFLKARNSDECFACHEDKTLTMDKNGKKVSIFVDPGLYKKSTHGGFDCKDCHEGYNPEELPHNPKKQKIDCKTCHDKVKPLDKSVHKNKDCYACHNPHYQKPIKESKGDNTAQCLNCHGNKNIKDFKTSIHSQKNLGCDACHKGGHEVQKIGKNEINTVCGKCHGSSQKDFNNSVHHTVLKGGNPNAPNCVTCHGSHRIVSSKMSIESQACLKCHLDEKLFPGEDRGSAKFIANYKTSIHSSIQKDGKPAAGCIDCHGDHTVEKMTDPKESTATARMIKTCGKCHSNEVKNFENSNHGQAFLKGVKDAPSCFDCHGEHNIKSVLQADEFSKINQADMCLKCHGDNKVTKGKNNHTEDYKLSFHYIALKNGNTAAATCSNCHGAHEMKMASDPTSNINKKNVDKTCGQSGCHTTQLTEYTGSVHEVSLMTKNNSDAPNCVDCHGNHQVKNTDSLGNAEGSKQRGIIKLCSSCHASVKIIQNNNLKNVAGTYLESFHGLAVRGGSKEAADCGSCHGNHNIRHSNDTLSSINKKNLGKTCGKCHPGASDVFINSKIHITDSDLDSPILKWISVIYIILIVATIGGMTLHNILDFRRKMKEKKAGH